VVPEIIPAGSTSIKIFKGDRVKVQATLFELSIQTRASVNALFGVVQIPPFHG
jgi:hypothetical protein